MPAAPSRPQAPVAAHPPIDTTPPPQMVTSHHGGGGKGRWIKAFLLLLIIALLAVGGYFAYQKNHKTSKVVTPAQSKDIPLLRIGIKQADYGGIYPNITDNDYSISVNSQMFEGLVRYQDRSKIAPDLASTWTNPDNNTWLFTIKKGIKFHDGHTLQPSDVKYSLDNMVTGTSDFAQTFAATIASVELVGTDQVKITTKAPDPTLLNKLTLLYVVDANTPKGDEPSQAGTGPYEIKPGTTPTGSSVQMTAFDGYHDGRPTTGALAFSSVADNPTLIKDFNAGQYDIAGTLSPGTASQAKNATVFNVSEADSDYLAFNTIQPSPVQNKLVREAIRYAVNAAAIGKANGQNLTQESQLVPPSIPGYDPAITPYKQNIDKAKQLLAQAGYPNGVTITLSTSSAIAPEATEITNELKQVGITVTLDQHTDFDEYINYFTAGKAEMYVIDYASDTLDAADIYQSTLLSANYNNPKVNDLLAQANTTLNPATRLKLLQQIAVLVDQDVPVVPLGTTADTWVMNKNYDIQQDSTSGYLPVYFYTVKLK
jgi:peptide/nickel transport system substrate-binding protein